MTKNFDNVFSLSERRRQNSRRGKLGIAHADAGAGRVQHDARGTAIWNWDVATGVLARSNSNELLQMLHNPSLQIAEAGGTVLGWAGDPYNRG
jgi:hypothetical protein